MPIRTITVLCTDTDFQDVVIDHAVRGKLIKWSRFHAHDYDHTPESILIGFKTGSQFYPIAGNYYTDNEEAWDASVDFMLGDEYQPVARFTGATSGDELVFTTIYDTYD